MKYNRLVRKRLRPNPIRTIIAIAGVLVSGFAMAENCTAQPVSGNTYNLVNEGSGKYLDVYYDGRTNGTNLVQWASSGRGNQQFILTDLGNGQWTITGALSGLVADVYLRGMDDGYNIQQWQFSEWNNNNQKWTLHQTDTGAYQIKAVHSGRFMTVATDHNGSNVYQYGTESGDRAAYQSWYLNPVNGRCDMGGPIGFASQPRSDDRNNTKLDNVERDSTTGGGNATPTEVKTCGALVSALQHSGDGAVIQIPDDTTIDCRSEDRRTVRVCEFTCGKKEPENPNKKILWSVGEGQDRTDDSIHTECKAIGAMMEWTETVRSDDLVNAVFRNQRIYVSSNTTLEGLGPNSRVLGATFILNGVNNIIVRNLRISHVNPNIIEAGDAFSIERSHHIWLDHIQTNMISDGHMDIYDTRNLTVSNHQFLGENPYMCGGKDPYVSIMDNVEATLHNNYWRHSAGRNPKVSGDQSQVHIFNNFWKDITYFGFASEHNAQVKLESSYFENSVKPHTIGTGGRIDTDTSQNIYTWSNPSDSSEVIHSARRVTDSTANYTLEIPYAYLLETASQARSQVVRTSGPR